MPNKNSNAVAVCGLYCGACWNWSKWHDKEDRFTPPEDDVTDQTVCDGCRSSRVSSGCAKCGIRECAQSRGFATCGECAEMPCDKTRQLLDVPRPHLKNVVQEVRRIGEIGEQAWADIQRDVWTCPKCGANTSWYQQTCPACGHPLRGFDPKDFR